MSEIKLGGKVFTIEPLPFGKLRLVLAAFDDLSKSAAGSTGFMENAARVFALITGKTRDEIDAMPISIKEMMETITDIPGICGLEEVSSGEVRAVQTGTNSTAI